MEETEYKIMYDMEKSYWWFVGKQFLIRNILKGLDTKSRDGNKVLDIGCGTGIILQLLKDFGTPYGTELSPKAIAFLKKRNLSNTVQSDAGQSIPFRTDTFSVVTCLDVLEHIDDDGPLIKEMFRVCKPGGHVILTVPAFEFLWSHHDVALHHKRRYTKKQVLTKTLGYDWKVNKCSYYNTLFFFPILAARQLKKLLSNAGQPRSDFFFGLPGWLNRVMSLLFVSEIRLLSRFSFPFGVSLVITLQKATEFDHTND